MKKKNIKIKHRSYSLYTKKKSKGRQALSVILTIVIIAALAVLGFGLGRPLMEYFNNRGSSDTSSGSAWTPPEQAVTEEAQDTTSQTTTATTEPEEESKPAEQKETAVFVLPAGALASSETLGSAVAAAKNNGYTSVMVTLKTSGGKYLYNTELRGIKGSDIVEGKLTAAQIADIIKKAGLTPVARISTLLDPMSGSYYSLDIKLRMSDGVGWLDGRVENGGKSWISAFEANTQTFISEITAEITSAGFKTIVYADTMHPVFKNYDKQYFTHLPIDDSEKRAEALWNVIDAGKKAAEANGAQLMLEIDYADLELTDRTATTAELMNSKDKAETVPILLDFTAESGNEYVSTKTMTGKMNGAYSGVAYSVLIKNGGMSAAGREQIEKALSESDITVFSE